MSHNKDVPLQKAQRRVIQTKLELGDADRTEVVNRLLQAANDGKTRVTMLAVVKFENGEVVVVRDMEAFVQSFDHTRHSDFRQISPDDYSIDLFGPEGEQAYEQSMCLADFFTKTHQGWYLMVRDVVATCKKPRNFWKMLGHALESREKPYKDYRLIVDLRKTNDIRQQPLLAQERFLLFGKAQEAPTSHSRANSDTLGSFSSGVFSRDGASTPRTLSLTEARPVTTPIVTSSPREPARPVLPEDLGQPASANESVSSSSSSSSSGDHVLDTSAKELSAEITESVKMRRQASSSSLSSSSSKARITYTLPKRVKKDPRDQ
jgi:hypothetical protein